MYQVSFGILHYINIEDTIACVESLLTHLKYDAYNIVVVDNGSANNSGKDLINRYHNHPKVKVITNQENLGYAQGHNMGFQYAKYELRSDFIVLLNNDTIIQQSDFIEVLINKYHQTQYDILGPDVISSVDDSHQNPHKQNTFTKPQLILFMWVLRIKLILNIFNLDQLIFKILQVLKISSRPTTIDPHIEQEGVVLHGSCLIFSPGYVKAFEGIFPDTFMFLEEDILYHQARSKGLKILYSPELRVIHHQGTSLNEVFQKDRVKRNFILKNKLRSSKILLTLLNST